jgi:hypothetical protein
VKNVAKYLQLAGTQIGTVIMTTPSRGLISSKVVEAIPDAYIGIISKDPHAYPHSGKPRISQVYEGWDYPDGKRGGVHRRWVDHYDAMLPDDFYVWYEPKRQGYVDIAKKMLRKETMKIMKLFDKSEEEDKKEDAYKIAPPEQVKELGELIDGLHAERAKRIDGGTEKKFDRSADGVPNL